MYKDWYIQQTLIHGDMKWNNILIVKDKYHDQISKIKIVDWEFSGIGDPAWDIRGVLHDFIGFWLFSLPITGNEDAENLVTSTQCPLDNLKKAIRSFWKEYLNSGEINESESDKLLIRSTRYCAIRLIQKAYELHQSSSQLTNIGIYLIQTGINIVLDIYDAILHLFGIPI